MGLLVISTPSTSSRTVIGSKFSLILAASTLPAGVPFDLLKHLSFHNRQTGGGDSVDIRPSYHGCYLTAPFLLEFSKYVPLSKEAPLLPTTTGLSLTEPTGLLPFASYDPSVPFALAVLTAVGPVLLSLPLL